MADQEELVPKNVSTLYMCTFETLVFKNLKSTFAKMSQLHTIIINLVYYYYTISSVFF